MREVLLQPLDPFLYHLIKLYVQNLVELRLADTIYVGNNLKRFMSSRQSLIKVTFTDTISYHLIELYVQDLVELRLADTISEYDDLFRF